MRRGQNDVLNELKLNIKRLVGRIKSLETDKANLEYELKKCLEKVSYIERKNIDLEKKLKMKNIADTFGGVGDRNEAKNSIDKILREVNNCIRLLDY